MAATFLIDLPRDSVTNHTSGNALPSLGADEVAAGARITTTHFLRHTNCPYGFRREGFYLVWTGLKPLCLILSTPRIKCPLLSHELRIARRSSELVLTLALVAYSFRFILVWRFRSPWPGRLHRHDPGQRKSNQGAALYLLVPRSARWPILPPMSALRFCSNSNNSRQHLVSIQTAT